MPELPEVETIVRGLSPVRGAMIDELEVLDQRLALPKESNDGASTSSFASLVVGISSFTCACPAGLP
jgi:formamidopyrimidine-DNA glycosylase